MGSLNVVDRLLSVFSSSLLSTYYVLYSVIGFAEGTKFNYNLSPQVAFHLVDAMIPKNHL